MDEKVVELEGRIIALEYLLKHAFWNIFVARADLDGEDQGEVIKNTREFASSISDDIAASGIQGRDAAMSDHLSGIAQDHALKLLHELLSDVSRTE